MVRLEKMTGLRPFGLVRRQSTTNISGLRPCFISAYNFYEDFRANAPKKIGMENICSEDIKARPLFLSLTYKSYEDVGANAPKQKKGRSPINFVENNANDRIRYIALKPSSKKYGKIE
jgi:hypothetical protein